MIKKIFYTLLVFIGLALSPQFLFAQESVLAPQQPETKTSTTIFEDYLKGYYSQVFGVDISQILNIDLYNSIEKWLGTPYRYAGKSLEGIDCSAFVNKIYENAYCYLLTGNSADLFKQVTLLTKDQLKEGDLVFFKINRKTISHVGVYLGGDKFAHASRSKGVVISDLNHPYYKKYFVKGGRVTFHSN
ncbi:MAG: C40 family peptidase [Bacteroidetes bacterium]|nr:C40 family peptidase [Bacteroidota bacterium]